MQRAVTKKHYRLPEAREAATAALEVLERHFPDADWLKQVQDGLEVYLERCITQFSGTPAPRNAGPIQGGGDYNAFARSAEEIKETMAAEEGSVTRARNVPRYRQQPDEVEIPEQELADPMRNRSGSASEPQQPPPARGWAL